MSSGYSAFKKKMVMRKVKFGWQRCKVADYVKVVRCFKCSKYGHQAQVCKGEETCPRCAGKYKVKDCTVSQGELKCVNSMTHNMHDPNNRVDENCSLTESNKYVCGICDMHINIVCYLRYTDE